MVHNNYITIEEFARMVMNKVWLIKYLRKNLYML